AYHQADAAKDPRVGRIIRARQTQQPEVQTARGSNTNQHDNLIDPTGTPAPPYSAPRALARTRRRPFLVARRSCRPARPAWRTPLQFDQEAKSPCASPGWRLQRPRAWPG